MCWLSSLHEQKFCLWWATSVVLFSIFSSQDGKSNLILRNSLKRHECYTGSQWTRHLFWSDGVCVFSCFCRPPPWYPSKREGRSVVLRLVFHAQMICASQCPLVTGGLALERTDKPWRRTAENLFCKSNQHWLRSETGISSQFFGVLGLQLLYCHPAHVTVRKKTHSTHVQGDAATHTGRNNSRGHEPLLVLRNSYPYLNQWECSGLRGISNLLSSLRSVRRVTRNPWLIAVMSRSILNEP